MEENAGGPPALPEGGGNVHKLQMSTNINENTNGEGG